MGEIRPEGRDDAPADLDDGGATMTIDLRCEIQADVLAGASAPDSTVLVAGAGLIGFGEPSTRQLESLNRLAPRPLAAAEVFVWPIMAIGNALTSYAFWPGASSLKNFERQANGPRGISYLRNHNQDQDAHGRVFAGALVDAGERAAVKAPKGSIPYARDVFRPAGSERDLRLVEMVYMPRGLTINGHRNDDLIANIEAGVQASVSVGLHFYTPLAPGSAWISDINGRDLFDGTSDAPTYFPGVDYEVDGPDGKKVVVTATAQLVNAIQTEVSGVFMGAAPEAYVERAAVLHAAGQLSLADARRLEETLRVQRGRIVGDVTTYSIAKTSGSDQPTAATVSTGPKPGEAQDGGDAVDPLARARELVGEGTPEWADLELHGVEADPVGALHTYYVEQLKAARAERDKAAESHVALKTALASDLGVDLAAGDTLAAGIVRLKGEAEAGREVREELVGRLFAQMTRAGLPPDEDKERELIASWSIDALKAKTEQYRVVADRSLTPGRVSDPADSLQARHDGDVTTAQPAPRRAARV